jgi:hypothetical protein
MIGTINRFGCSLNADTRRRIVNAFVVPKLHYALPVWCWVDKAEEKAFDHTILRCARVIMHNKAITLNSTTFNATNLLPFKQMLSLRCLIRTHQLMSSQHPDHYLPSCLTSGGSERVTRNISGRKFSLPAHFTTSDTACFSYMAAKSWNELPQSITSTLNINHFITCLNQHILLQLQTNRPTK